MPRPRRKHTDRKIDASVNSTCLDLDSNTVDSDFIKVQMWKAEVKDKMRESVRKLDDMKREKLAMFELEFRKSLLSIPSDVLNTPVDMNDEKFRSFILGIKVDTTEEYDQSPSPTVAPRTVKRRSKSASNVKFSTRASKRGHRLRSTSVEVYKTPKGRVRLSAVMSKKKYTVMKPKKPQNSGVNVKRIMKPDEEAISTCGSPLYVASSNVHAPHVNIPLPGGVVLNIEPKPASGELEIPDLDQKTKNQIKLLCEQLNKLF